MSRLLLIVLIPFMLSACLNQDSVIGIDNPYAFATAPGAKNGAAFLTILNEGGGDTLLSASADIAARTEIHDMSMEDGVMKMRQLETLSIPRGKTIELAPQGKHIMFLDLTAPLNEGASFDLTLTFEKAGAMTFPVMIVAAGQKPDPDAAHDHHENDGHAHH